MRFSIFLSFTLIGCGSRMDTSDAGASHDDPIVSERGSDGRFTWTPETVLDDTTKLTWDRVADRGTFAEAERICAERGERLPTREELLAVLGDDREPAMFQGSGDWYWSSTKSSNTAGAWVVGIARYTNTHGFDALSSFRCVR